MLAWGRDAAGRRVHVRDLDPAERHARAPFHCLGCGEEILPHLGKVRARHFAHRPGSTCPLTAPETILHLDAKMRLLALCELAFSGARKVVLVARCPRCRRRMEQELAALGDAAALEERVGNLRPDLLVTDGGKPSLALEVRVTHGLDEEKERALEELGLRMVEVDAHQEWEVDEGEVTTVLGCRSAGFGICPACDSEARSALGRSEGGEAADLAELEAYRARGLFGPRPGRPVAEPPALSDLERRRLAAEFLCRDCGGRSLEMGDRLVRHACPGRSLRAVAWRGYDGELVVLRWWQRG